MAVDVERQHIRKTVAIHEKMLGSRPLGIYQGKPNENTRRLVVEEGGFLWVLIWERLKKKKARPRQPHPLFIKQKKKRYDSDSYADDLPYWNYQYGRPHLIVPYTLDNNDMVWLFFFVSFLFFLSPVA